MQHIKSIPFPVKLGLGVSAGMIVVSGVFFAALKETTETEKFGYGDVLLWSSLVGGLSGLVSGAIASCAMPQQGVVQQRAVRPESISGLIDQPQPIDALKRLGETPAQQMANAGTYAFVTGKPLHEYNTMLKQVQEVAKMGQQLSPHLPEPVMPEPVEYELPQPVSPSPSRAEPRLYGEEEESVLVNGFSFELEDNDLWETEPRGSAVDSEGWLE